MLELPDELAESRLGKLLRVEWLGNLVQGVFGMQGAALAVLLVEEAEVVESERWDRLLVERRNLIQNVDRFLVATLGEEELRTAGESGERLRIKRRVS